MAKIKKCCVYTIFIYLCIACSKDITIPNNDCAIMMAEYYVNHLKYPKTGEEFCKMFYLSDSINEFSRINGFSDDEEQVRQYDFDGYNSSMRSRLVTLWKAGLISTPMVWTYIYDNRENIVFSENDSSIIIKNNKNNRVNIVKNYHKLAENIFLHQSDMSQYDPFDLRLVWKSCDLYFYTKDSVCVEKSTEETAGINKRLHDIIGSLISTKKNNPRVHILRYSSDKSYNSCIHEDTVPHVLKENKTLSCYLDSCINSDDRIDFVTFGLKL